MTNPAKVFLVGAGPGHPGLLTLRAVECLGRADLVLYDKLVPVAALDHAPAQARRVCVAELAPHHAQRHVPIHEIMIEAARGGQTVVRLKGGDPCLFGRAGEEAQALREANIPFEIVPGVTAAAAAGAYSGIPLTHRSMASAVAFLTGHEDPGKPESALDWSALARFPGTLAIYMGMSRLEAICRALMEAGKPPATPAAVVQGASLGEQRTVRATLADLPDAVRAAGLTPPAMVLVGEVVSLRQELAWFEKLPLVGLRVLVTRPRHQAGDLVARLIDLGATPISGPAVAILEPEDWAPVDQAIARLDQFDWIVFTSANGPRAFFDRLISRGRDLRALARVRLAAIGPKTAAMIRQYHLKPDLIPQRFQSEDLAQALREKIQPGERVLLARADRGRDLLREELAKVCQVDQVAVYRQVDALTADDPLFEPLRRGEIDFITLTSSNIARALLSQLDSTTQARLHSGGTRLVSISQVTSADIEAMGYRVAAQAREATTEGIVEALVDLATRQTPGPK